MHTSLPYRLLLLALWLYAPLQSIAQQTVDRQQQAVDATIATLVHRHVRAQAEAERYLDKITSWPDTAMIDVGRLSPLFILDLRYATTENFAKKAVYPCAQALLRKQAALALLQAQQELWQKYRQRIKLFDCYRPLSVQYALWAIMPDTTYLADPRKGSMHNRGVAVDLTLCTADGRELEMGTPFDFFGPEAWHGSNRISAQATANRKHLYDLLFRHGFKGTDSEWWHYSMRNLHAPLSDQPFSCATD